MEITDIFKNINSKLDESRLAKLQSESVSSVNIREFDGSICLAVDGIPVFRVSDLNISYDQIPKLLEKSRKMWVSYHSKF